MHCHSAATEHLLFQQPNLIQIEYRLPRMPSVFCSTVWPEIAALFPTSMRLMEASDTSALSANSRRVQPTEARAARNCLAEIIRLEWTISEKLLQCDPSVVM